MNLHIDVRGRVNASIKRKERQFRKWGTNHLSDHGALKKKNHKIRKLLGRGLRIGATQVVLEKSPVRYAGFILVRLP